MPIDPSSPTPLYYQVELDLRSRIEGGEWKPGEMIPTEAEICEHYGVSRTTARQALANLVHQGSLIRRPGIGTFVVQQRIEGTMHGGLFHQKMRAAGLEPRREVLSFDTVPARPATAEALSIQAGDPLLAVRRRLHGGDELIVSYADIFMPRDLVPTLTRRHFEEMDTHRVLQREGLRPQGGHVNLEARLSDVEDAKILRIDQGLPVLTVERTTFLTNGRPFEYIRWVGRADMVSFSTDFKVSGSFVPDLLDAWGEQEPDGGKNSPVSETSG